MAYFEFPHTRTYDNDLGWLIWAMKKLIGDWETFADQNSIKFADPIEWAIDRNYESRTIVLDSDGNGYISKQAVPSGISLDNGEYWQQIFNISDLTETIRNNIAANAGSSSTTPVELQEGQLVWWNGNLYQALIPMAAGTAFIPDVNVQMMTVDEKIEMYADQTETIRNNIAANAGNSDTTPIELQEGQLVWWNGDLYQVLIPMTPGTAFIPNVNVHMMTVDEKIELNSDQIEELAADIADIEDRLEREKWINVKVYGAAGDGVTDDTSILQEIADTGYNMYFPKGKYYLSDTLEIGQSQMLLGSAEGAELVQHSTNPASAVLAVGNRATVYALSLAYAPEVPIETASQENHFVGLCLHSIKAPYNFQRSGIYKVRIYHVGNGITDWHPSLNAPSGMFSVGIHDCEIVYFSVAGISLTGGSTGDHLDNVYITAGYTDGGTADAKLREARYGVHIKGNRALNVTNVNIEWGLFSYNPFMAEGSCIIGDSLHFEEVGLKGSYRGVMNLINSDVHLASVAFNFPWLYTNGTKLFTLGNGGIANPYNSDPDRGSKRSDVDISTLLLNGLNNPAYQIFPSAYFPEKGLTYAPNWGLVNREANLQGEYGFKIDNYTYNCPYADDLAAYEDPPRNPHSTIDIVKLGTIKEYGTYADRPTKRLCRYHTRYVASNMNYGEYLFIGYHTDGANPDNWIRISDGPQWREVEVTKGEIFQNAQVLTATYNEYRGLLKLHLQGTPSATSGTLGVVQGINRGGKVAFPYGNGVYVLTLAGDGTLTLSNPLNGPAMAWTHMSILMPLN